MFRKPIASILREARLTPIDNRLILSACKRITSHHRGTTDRQEGWVSILSYWALGGGLNEIQVYESE